MGTSVTILAAPETLAPDRDAPTACPLAEAAALLDVVREQQGHALTVLGELLALMPSPPSSFTVCTYGSGFRSGYGVVVVMPTQCTDLTEVQCRLGGSLMVEVREDLPGKPYIRHELTGTHAGVPFEVWTNVYPKFLPGVAA
jgi:hypothetical protein